MSVYTCSDIHGCYWAWEQIKNILQPGDILYFLGDANDRGPDGWRIIKELLDDGRVIYLMGNHEKMFLNNWGSYSDGCAADNYRYDDHLWIWYQNGGQVTENQFIEDTIPGEVKASYIRQLRELPFITVYHNINNEDVILCHAGCNYHDVSNLTEENAIWDRNHFVTNRWDGPSNTYIIHGHTPIPYLMESQEDFARWNETDFSIPKAETWEGAYWYAGGHKCCVDCGTAFTDQCVLLDLDTWNEIIINKE